MKPTGENGQGGAENGLGVNQAENDLGDKNAQFGYGAIPAADPDSGTRDAIRRELEKEVVDVSRDGMHYPHNVLEAFGTGAMCDARVRFANELLVSSPIFHGLAVHTPMPQYRELAKEAARLALEIADELFSQGEARGMIEPLSEDAELTEALRLQAARTAKFQALQQVEGGKALAAEQGSVIPNRAPIMGRGH